LLKQIGRVFSESARWHCMARERVTLREIAAKAGVTPAIASRVLNNKPDVRVADATRARIVEAAREANYRPDPFARVLRSGKSSLIILVAPQSFYLMGARKTNRMQLALHSLDHPVMTADINMFGDPDAAVEFLMLTRPTAIVWMAPDRSEKDFAEMCSDIRSRDTHIIAADYPSQLPPDVPCDAVTVDRAHGCYLAASHLLDRRGDKVAFIGTDRGGRVEGFRRALKERNIDREIIYFTGPEDPPHGSLAVTRRLLEEQPDIRGIFCHSDISAIGAIAAIREAGLTIPDDIAVAGYDNEPWTEFLDVPLTTVAHPIEQLSSLSMTILRGRMEGNSDPWCRVTLQPPLIVRESTGGAGLDEAPPHPTAM